MKPEPLQTEDAIFTTDEVITTLRQAQNKPPRRYQNLRVKRGKNEAMKNCWWYYKTSFLDNFLHRRSIKRWTTITIKLW